MKSTVIKTFSLLLGFALAACGDATTGAMGVFFTPGAQNNQPQVDPNQSALKSIYLYSNSTAYGGYLGDRAAIDLLCRTDLPSELSAYEAHAVISIDVNDQLKNLSTTFGFARDEAIYGYDSGIKIANNWNDFIEGVLLATLKDAQVFSGAQQFWTGSDAVGSVSVDTCDTWQDDDPGSAFEGTVGSSILKTNWIDDGAIQCGTLLKILCIAVK